MSGYPKTGTSIALLISVLVAAIAVSGCAYINVKTPYDANLDRTELGTKKGYADAHSILWLFTWGDTSYATAAENGNITVIRHADQEIRQVLFGLYTRWRIIVYGD
jgi:hypothetical protein